MGGATTDTFTMTKTNTCNFGVLCAPATLPPPRRDSAKEPAPGAEAAAPREDVAVAASRRVRGPGSSVAAAAKLVAARQRASAIPGSVPAAQKLALIELYHATGGPAWNRSTNWLSNSDPCDPDRHVQET